MMTWHRLEHRALAEDHRDVPVGVVDEERAPESEVSLDVQEALPTPAVPAHPVVGGDRLVHLVDDQGRFPSDSNGLDRPAERLAQGTDRMDPAPRLRLRRAAAVGVPGKREVRVDVPFRSRFEDLFDDPGGEVGLAPALAREDDGRAPFPEPNALNVPVGLSVLPGLDFPIGQGGPPQEILLGERTRGLGTGLPVGRDRLRQSFSHSGAGGRFSHRNSRASSDQ